MTERVAVYHAIDRVLSNRDRADRVLSLCFEGDLAGAKRLLATGEDADSLLARGMVGYWLARTGTEVSYEQAKDLLSKATRLFTESGDRARASLADIWIGLCYWRQGQFDEALVMLAQSSRSDDHRIRFLALINRSVIHTEANRWKDCLETLTAARESFDYEPSLSWRGKFFQQRGLAYRLAFNDTQDVSYLDKALLDYESASDCYERANNLRFEAAIANQIASVYRALGRYRDASRQADRAILLYERMRDRSHLAIAKDTKALILMDEGKHASAKQYATQAIDLLRHHDPAWIIIPLVTRAKILCRMQQYALAQRDFSDAISIAERTGNRTKAAELYLEQAESLETYLSISALSDIFARIHELSPSRLTAVTSRILKLASAPELNSLKDLKSAEMKTEFQMILKMLEAENGSITGAAKALGKTRAGLAHIIKTRHPELLKHCRDARSVKSTVR